jgi:hypothetical protein
MRRTTPSSVWDAHQFESFQPGARDVRESGQGKSPCKRGQLVRSSEVATSPTHLLRTEDRGLWSYSGDRFIKDGLEYEPSNVTAAGAVLDAVLKLPWIPCGIYALSYATSTKNLITF